MVYYLLVYIPVISFLLAVALVPLVMRMALRWGVVDKPGERKIHHTPKPLLGGVAFYTSFMLVVMGPIAVTLLLKDNGAFREQFPEMIRRLPHLLEVLPRLLLILGTSSGMMVVGICDDVFKTSFSYKWKFLGQLIAATVLVMGGIRTEFMPREWLDILISIVWIVGITNSFNLLDNMDGLSAGVATIAGMVFFFITFIQGQIFMAAILAALTGAVAGFLIYNFNPARLFMGDSGSLFIGFIFGALTLLSSYRIPGSRSLMPVIMPVLILSIPLYDTFSVMFIRWREKRPIYIGDNSHFSHRLVALGFTQRGTVLFIYLVALCVGCGAALLPYIPVWGSVLVLIQTIIIYILITALMVISMKNK